MRFIKLHCVKISFVCLIALAFVLAICYSGILSNQKALKDKFRDAILNKDYEKAEQCIAAGVDIYGADEIDEEERPLGLAIGTDDVKMFVLLLQHGATLIPPGTTMEVYGYFPITPLLVAILNDSQNVAKYILDNNLLTDEDDYSSIFEAAILMDNYELVKYILQHSPATVDDLREALLIRNIPPSEEYDTSYEKICRRLIEEGILEKNFPCKSYEIRRIEK